MSNITSFYAALRPSPAPQPQRTSCDRLTAIRQAFIDGLTYDDDTAASASESLATQQLADFWLDEFDKVTIDILECFSSVNLLVEHLNSACGQKADPASISAALMLLLYRLDHLAAYYDRCAVRERFTGSKK